MMQPLQAFNPKAKKRFESIIVVCNVSERGKFIPFAFPNLLVDDRDLANQNDYIVEVSRQSKKIKQTKSKKDSRRENSTEIEIHKYEEMLTEPKEK